MLEMSHIKKVYRTESIETHALDFIARHEAERAPYFLQVAPYAPHSRVNALPHYAGDPLLNELIDSHAPDLVLCGHVHDSPFRKGGSWIDRVGSSWVFNPGRQLGELPTFIELDLTRRTAAWRSLAGAEERMLE